jgi:hypothetical protein
MEFLLGAVTGYLLSWPALGFLIAWAIYAEHSDSSGWALFASIIAGAIAFFMFDVPVKTLAYSALAYAVIGIGWSFWRYKRYVEVRVEEIKRNGYVNDPHSKKRELERLSPKEMTSSIVSWIIIWPVSLVENLVSDIITGLEKLVRGWLNKVYTSIYSSATKDL